MKRAHSAPTAVMQVHVRSVGRLKLTDCHSIRTFGSDDEAVLLSILSWLEGVPIVSGYISLSWIRMSSIHLPQPCLNASKFKGLQSLGQGSGVFRAAYLDHYHSGALLVARVDLGLCLVFVNAFAFIARHAPLSAACINRRFVRTSPYK